MWLNNIGRDGDCLGQKPKPEEDLSLVSKNVSSKKTDSVKSFTESPLSVVYGWEIFHPITHGVRISSSHVTPTPLQDGFEEKFFHERQGDDH